MDRGRGNGIAERRHRLRLRHGNGLVGELLTQVDGDDQRQDGCDEHAGGGAPPR